MITSKTCELAIRALIIIAKRGPNQSVRIAELHKELDIGMSYMTKVLQPLTRAGILISKKGVKGGVLLNKDPAKITLRSIVEIMDGNDLFVRCVLGLPKCSNQNPCSFHSDWAKIRALLTEKYENATLESFKDS